MTRPPLPIHYPLGRRRGAEKAAASESAQARLFGRIKSGEYKLAPSKPSPCDLELIADFIRAELAVRPAGLVPAACAEKFLMLEWISLRA